MRTDKIPAGISRDQAAFGRAIAHQYGFPCVLVATATPTLSETGLLAQLLKQQHLKTVAFAQRRMRREHLRAALRNTFISPFRALQSRRRIQEWTANFVRTMTHYPPKTFVKA